MVGLDSCEIINNFMTYTIEILIVAKFLFADQSPTEIDNLAPTEIEYLAKSYLIIPNSLLNLNLFFTIGKYGKTYKVVKYATKNFRVSVLGDFLVCIFPHSD